MPFKADGTWEQEDASTASHVAKLQSQDSALMRGAIASGMKSANRRGLINSSMGVGAGVSAALGAVTPIASQDAQQAHQRNLFGMEDKQKRDLNRDAIASQDRSNYSQALTSMAGNYQSGIANTLTNDKIPAATRSQAQADMAAIYRANQEQIARFYGVQLNWS